MKQGCIKTFLFHFLILVGLITLLLLVASVENSNVLANLSRLH